MARTGYHFFMGDVLPRAFHYLVELNSIVFSAGAYRGSLIMTEMLMEKLLAGKDFPKKETISEETGKTHGKCKRGHVITEGLMYKC